MSLYAKLNPHDPLLPDSDEVSRYCSPNEYDLTRSEPKVSAFQRKQSERNPMRDPSINRLQYFQLEDRDSAVECTRSLSEKQYSKRYASLVECKDVNNSTTKSRVL